MYLGNKPAVASMRSDEHVVIITSAGVRKITPEKLLQACGFYSLHRVKGISVSKTANYALTRVKIPKSGNYADSVFYLSGDIGLADPNAVQLAKGAAVFAMLNGRSVVAVNQVIGFDVSIVDVVTDKTTYYEHAITLKYTGASTSTVNLVLHSCLEIVAGSAAEVEVLT